MRTITARNPHDSFSFSRRFFPKKKIVEDDDIEQEILAVDPSSILPSSSSSSSKQDQTNFRSLSTGSAARTTTPRKKLSVIAIAKLRSALAIGKARTHYSGLGSKVVVGTLFGHRRGHVHFALQEDFKAGPGFLVELATPTSVLIKEMASGLVRIALECDKKVLKKGFKLLEEPIWRAYCNGKKCGYAMRRDCGPEEWKVLNAIGPITMGAGVLPGAGPDGEMMYMRAKFERVVGSKDSEAFYMVNPDGHGGPELSIYLLRV